LFNREKQGKHVAGLGQLKFAMGSSIFILMFIFSAFLAAIFFILQVDLILAIVLAVAFILFQYLIGPAIVRASTRLQYLQSGQNPWLESTVKEIAEKSGVPMPRLAIVPDKTPNAFVFGRTAKSATLAVHEGLLANLNENEIRGVIAHEIGHLRHKDYLVMTILSALPLLAYMVARATWTTAMFSRGGRQKNEASMGAALVAIGVLSYVVYVIAQLAVLRLSRLREHYADAYSAYVTGQPRNLESALTKITYGLSLSPSPPSGVRAFYIGDPAMAKQEIGEIMEKKDEYDLNHDGVLDERELEIAMEKEAKSTWSKVNMLFATHPPTFKRILMLREIENEMTNGKYTSDRIYAHV
jgi:heat shock protein HtpX